MRPALVGTRPTWGKGHRSAAARGASVLIGHCRVGLGGNGDHEGSRVSVSGGGRGGEPDELDDSGVRLSAGRLTSSSLLSEEMSYHFVSVVTTRTVAWHRGANVSMQSTVEDNEDSSDSSVSCSASSLTNGGVGGTALPHRRCLDKSRCCWYMWVRP